jgi:hypothetical protein
MQKGQTQEPQKRRYTANRECLVIRIEVLGKSWILVCAHSGGIPLFQETFLFSLKKVAQLRDKLQPSRCILVTRSTN